MKSWFPSTDYDDLVVFFMYEVSLATQMRVT